MWRVGFSLKKIKKMFFSLLKPQQILLYCGSLMLLVLLLKRYAGFYNSGLIFVDLPPFLIGCDSAQLLSVITSSYNEVWWKKKRQRSPAAAGSHITWPLTGCAVIKHAALKPFQNKTTQHWVAGELWSSSLNHLHCCWKSLIYVCSRSLPPSLWHIIRPN